MIQVQIDTCYSLDPAQNTVNEHLYEIQKRNGLAKIVDVKFTLSCNEDGIETYSTMIIYDDGT